MAIGNLFGNMGNEEEIDPETGLPIIKAPQLGDVASRDSITPDMLGPSSGSDAATPKVDIKDYIMKKYGLGDKYSDEARSKLQDESKIGMGEGLMAALAAIGAGYQGKDAGAAGFGALNNMKAGKERKLEQFDKGRAAKMQDFAFDRDMTKAGMEDKQFEQAQEKLKRESDPTSAESKIAQDLAVSMGMSPEQAAGLTASKFKDFSPAMQKKYEIEQKKLDRDLDRANKDREFGLKERELGLKEKALSGEANKFKMLPKDQQETITTLAKDNAGKIAITNSIDSVLDKWDSMSQEQKLQQGRQLIKTLNSTQGKDAVGAEESKRLAGKLEFALGNFSNDNPTQFGRDLEGFKEDARITSQAIKDAAKANQAIIDQYSGRSPKAPQASQEQKSGYAPGDIVKVKGKSYRVGSDGDSLEEI